MHKPSISFLVYSKLYPKPSDTDPISLNTFAQRFLIPEIHEESLRYYGANENLETRFPGLDYASPGHRLRLGRFPYHKRFFEVLDSLRLTSPEIHGLCRWEFTKWARERLEIHNGIKVRDTTWDGIPEWIPNHPPFSTVGQLAELRAGELWRPSHMNGKEQRGSTMLANQGHIEAPAATTRHEGSGECDDEFCADGIDREIDDVEDDPSDEDDEDGDEESDGRPDFYEQESEDEPLSHSVGVELNRRLMAATEARARGEEVVLDPAWEQWLKEAVERGSHLGPAGLSDWISSREVTLHSTPAQQTHGWRTAHGQVRHEAGSAHILEASVRRAIDPVALSALPEVITTPAEMIAGSATPPSGTAI